MGVLLETHGLVKAFGGFHAVDNVDLVVNDGEIRSVIGPNGAGKTTLFNVVTGHLRPTHGHVRFAGEDITGKSPHTVTRHGLARAFQITNVFPRMTVLESVQCAVLARRRRTSDFVTWYHRSARDAAMEVIEAVGLVEVAEQEARTLSHGDQRALEVALALATGPRLLLLDEPTAGMSPWETERTVELVRDLARARGLTVLFCEHDMNVVFAISDRITVMHQGRVIAEGVPEEVRQNEEVVRVYLGDQV